MKPDLLDTDKVLSGGNRGGDTRSQLRKVLVCKLEWVESGSPFGNLWGAEEKESQARINSLKVLASFTIGEFIIEEMLP